MALSVSDPATIEEAIVQIAEGMKRVLGTRLKLDTIVTLIHADTGIAKRDIKALLTSLDHLEATYLKPKAK